jgi:triosephosphate isomerase
MPRRKLIAANWKMYKTPSEAREFMTAFLPRVSGHTRDEIVRHSGTCHRGSNSRKTAM